MSETRDMEEARDYANDFVLPTITTPVARVNTDLLREAGRMRPLPVFDAENHLYHLDGRPVPGVTTILRVRSQPWLAPWKVKMALAGVRSRLMGFAQSEEQDEFIHVMVHELDGVLLDARKDADRKIQEADDIGHEIHQWIKDYIASKGQPNEMVMPTEPRALASVKAFLAWVDKEQPEWLLSEQVVMHEAEWYAGTLDSVAKLKGGVLAVIDVKSSARVSSDHYLQTAAYLMAADDCGVIFHDASRYQRLILRVPKDGGAFEAHWVKSNLDHDWAAFRACRTLLRWSQEIERVKGERS